MSYTHALIFAEKGLICSREIGKTELIVYVEFIEAAHMPQ